MSEAERQRVLGFEKNLSEFILDPLYGPIGLTREEKNIVNTRVFTRLKGIRQLGLVGEFYHGATHTRYEHSLGTLYVAWMMFKRYIENTRKYKAWVPKDIVRYFSDDTIRALRFAALLHDLGHGPFSHSLEEISEYFGARIDHDKVTQFLLSDRKDQVRISKRMYDAISENEDLGLKFLRQRFRLLIILNRSSPSMRRKILCILNPDHSYLFKDSNFLAVKDFLNALISGDVGADRIDYLLRDAYYTGLGHRFNLSDLLDNIASIYDKGGKKLRFALDSNAKDVSDFFLTTRYYHYRLIAHNLKNIDELAKLKERVNKWQSGCKGEFLEKFIDLTLENEMYFEKKVPVLDQWDFKRIGAWFLGDVRTDFYRFLIYRLMLDRRLRNYYLSNIIRRLRFGLHQFQNLDMNGSDFRLEFVLEKPHIPVMCAYRERYVEHKSSRMGRVEDDQMSSLLHDYSEMISGLARTYLSNVAVVVYARRQHAEEIAEYTSKTFDFFVNKDLFTSVLKRLNLKNLNRLDIMLCAFYSAYKNHVEIDSLTKLCKIIRNLQEKLQTPSPSYEFGKLEGYEPEEQKPFDYPSDIINDLFLFDYSGIIAISKTNRNIFAKRIGPPKYMSCYNLEFPPQMSGVNLLRALDCYPQKYRRLIERLSRS